MADCTAGTDVEVEGAETGGGFTWGERPLMSLLLSLLLLFFVALIAEDMAQETACPLQAWLLPWMKTV